VQKTTNIDKDGNKKVETWYEALSVPGSLRIDFTPIKDGNGILFTDRKRPGCGLRIRLRRLPLFQRSYTSRPTYPNNEGAPQSSRHRHGDQYPAMLCKRRPQQLLQGNLAFQTPK
jgi:hypothetical protein